MTPLDEAVAAFFAQEGGYRKLARRFKVEEPALREAVAAKSPVRLAVAPSPARTPAHAKPPPATKADPPPPEPIADTSPLALLRQDMAETRRMMEAAQSSRPAAMTAASTLRRELNRLREIERELLAAAEVVRVESEVPDPEDVVAAICTAIQRPYPEGFPDELVERIHEATRHRLRIEEHLIPFEIGEA